MNIKTKTIMKRIINIGAIAILLSIIFVPNVKAYVQQGLMKVGLFKPDFKDDKIAEPTAVEETSANYQMSFTDVNGKSVNLEDLKGKVVFINFWATWCPPCVAEMPTIQTLYDKMKDEKDVLFVLMEVEGNKAKAEKFWKDKNLTMPIYYPNGPIPSEFFQGALPTTVILDKKGNIAHVTKGMANYAGQNVVDFINEVRKK